MLRTYMLLRRDKLIERKEKLLEQVQVIDAQLEELQEVVRTKGPYKSKQLNNDFRSLSEFESREDFSDV